VKDREEAASYFSAAAIKRGKPFLRVCPDDERAGEKSRAAPEPAR